MSIQKYDVVVLGAGIIGAAVAKELQKRGRQVALLDKDAPGHGCSYGNAGWITPCFATPLPQPGMLLKAMKWMLDPESPLYIQPHADPAFIKWLLQFMRNMNEKKMHRSIAVLTAISKESLASYRALSERYPDTGFEQKGLLNICETDDSLHAMKGEMAMMAEHGIEGQLLSPQEVVALEPSVRPEKIKGGVYYPHEAHAEPLAMVEALVKDFQADGGILLPRQEVYDFQTSQNRITKIKTTAGEIEADLVVWALGSWSEHLGKQLGLRIPVLGGKGYGMIIDDKELTTGSVKPRHPIMIVDRKIAVTPRAHSLRLAGTLELVKMDFSITPRRVNAVLKGSTEFLRIPPTFQLDEVWRGLRPCTPDGVPMVGFSKKWTNLFYSTGHQMLGLQSSPGSAKLAAELIEGATPYVDPTPFIPERF